MSGHSKWATIKHKKAATDAKRGRIFTKLIREITIAARVAGGDPDSNPRLRTAILAAKNENMPNDNIERALARGTGQLEGEQYEEVNFEGYGPGGVGMIVQVVTTNRNRIVSELRHMMNKHGGNMAENGAVGWMFHREGDIVVFDNWRVVHARDEVFGMHVRRHWRGWVSNLKTTLQPDYYLGIRPFSTNIAAQIEAAAAS